MREAIFGTRVSDWMASAVPVVTLRTSVRAALHLARDHGLTALPVCDKGRFVGLVSEKDLLALTPSRATTLSRFEMTTLLEKITVGAVTKSARAAVRPDASLCMAADIMVRNSSEILPVVEDDRLAGIITWKEILAAASGDCDSSGTCEAGAFTTR